MPHARMSQVLCTVSVLVLGAGIARDMIDLRNFKGTAALVENAVKFKYTAAPLTEAQLKELIQIPGAK